MRIYQGVCASALLAFATIAVAQNYHVADQWKLGGEGGWDYLVSDDAAHRLYITHNARVVDSRTGKARQCHIRGRVFCQTVLL